MRRRLAILVFAIQILSLAGTALPQALYALHPALFAAHCVNKSRPRMHCNGMCMMAKATIALSGIQAGPAMREEVPVREACAQWIEAREQPACSRTAPHPPQALDQRPLESSDPPDEPPPKPI